MDTLTILEKAKALIEDPAHWCQRVYAKGLDDKAVYPSSKNAVCWCAIGAIRATVPSLITSPDQSASRAMTLLYAAADSITLDMLGKNEGITYINDLMGHKTVMRLYDKAIKLAKEEAAHAGPSV